MQCLRRSLVVILLGSTLVGPPALGAAGSPGFIAPPAPGGLIADSAGVLGEVSGELNASLSELHTQAGVPVVIATIPSLSKQAGSAKQAGTDGWTHERYAAALMTYWSQLPSEVAVAPKAPNPGGANSGGAGPGASAALRLPAGFSQRGLLLLLSVDDHRLALAGGYERAFDERSDRLARRLGELLDESGVSAGLKIGMETITEYVKKGRVSLAGDIFVAMSALVVLVLCLVTLIAYLRQGADSAPCRLWVSFFSALGFLIAFLLRRGVHLTSGIGAAGANPRDAGRVVIGTWPDRPERTTSSS